MVKDLVVEWNVDAVSLVDAFWDVAAVRVDVVLGFDEVGERSIAEDSLLEDVVGADVILVFIVVDEDSVDGWTLKEAEDVADLVSRLDEEVGRRVDDDLVPEDLEKVNANDAVLDFFDADEGVVDETSAFEEADVVADAILTLDETVERRVDRGLVLEERVRADDEVVPEVFGVSEDKGDDTWTVEDEKDFECAVVDSNSKCVEVVEDEWDIATFLIDVVLGLDEVVERRVDDDSVLEATEEAVGTNNNVILVPVDVGEDDTDFDSVLNNVENVVGGEIDPVPRPDSMDEVETDVDSGLEKLEDIASVEVVLIPRSVEAVEGNFDNIPVGEDERDEVGVFIDDISCLERVLVPASPSEVNFMPCLS